MGRRKMGEKNQTGGPYSPALVATLTISYKSKMYNIPTYPGKEKRDLLRSVIEEEEEKKLSKS
jgi:hypothetical protein